MAINNSDFAVQLLTKIGSPLMGAINDGSAGDEAAQEQAAQTMAQLLGQAVQMGTLLYNAVGIEEEAAQADTTRVALTSLCAPLIANFYSKNKSVPTEDDTKRMVQSLEGILSFGENFSPASEAQSRLQTIDQEAVLFDKSQPTLVVLQAMVPVINAVEEFSFGQAPRKLVQDVSAKLEARAQDIVKNKPDGDKLQELIVFKSLASLYAQCHVDEVKRVSESGDENRDNLSIDPVWEHFETKVSMVETLMGVGGEPEADAEQAPTLAKTPDPAPTEKTVASSTAEAPAAATGGPMGFFKKPTGNEQENAPAAETPAAVQEAPKEAASTPVATPETEAKTDDAPPASPMGFFKPGAKKADSNDDA